MCPWASEGGAGRLVLPGPTRGQLPGGAPTLVRPDVFVGALIGFHCVDERPGAQVGGGGREIGRGERCRGGGHAQMQGRGRRGPTANSARHDGFAQRAPVRPNLGGLGGALPHPVPQVAAD